MRKMNRIFIVFLPIIIALCIPHVSYAKGEETLISETAYDACVEYGEQYGISPELLMAIIELESGGKPDAENGSCKGLMQVSEKWNKDRMKILQVTDLFDERENILVGADYLAELLDKHEDAAVALMVYNGDSRAFDEGYVSGYAEDILRRVSELEKEHGKEGRGNAEY